MNEKFYIAEYLVNLMHIMEGKEDAGRARGNTLAEEYNRQYTRLTELIKTEQENARKSNANAERSEAGTTEPGGEPRRGESNRASAR